MSERQFEFGDGDPHSGPLPHLDSYWACDKPERPVDGRTIFDVRCSRCLVGLQAYRLRGGTDLVGWSQSKFTTHEITVDEAFEVLEDR